jgi:hypothetical protein
MRVEAGNRAWKEQLQVHMNIRSRPRHKMSHVVVMVAVNENGNLTELYTMSALFTRIRTV